VSCGSTSAGLNADFATAAQADRQVQAIKRTTDPDYVPLAFRKEEQPEAIHATPHSTIASMLNGADNGARDRFNRRLNKSCTLAPVNARPLFTLRGIYDLLARSPPPLLLAPSPIRRSPARYAEVRPFARARLPSAGAGRVALSTRATGKACRTGGTRRARRVSRLIPSSTAFEETLPAPRVASRHAIVQFRSPVDTRGSRRTREGHRRAEAREVVSLRGDPVARERLSRFPQKSYTVAYEPAHFEEVREAERFIARLLL
jgi:hypothetical protein